MNDIIKYLLDSRLDFKIVGLDGKLLSFTVQGRDTLKFDMEKCSLDLVISNLERQIESIIKTIN
jgi:hypothetical protein